MPGPAYCVFTRIPSIWDKTK